MSIRLVAFVVVLWLLGVPAGAARQPPWSSRPDEPGNWLPWRDSCTSVQGPLGAEWGRQLRDIGALVRACPVFTEIRGYYPELVGCVQSPGGGPYQGTVRLLIWPPDMVERTAKGEPRLMDQWREHDLKAATLPRPGGPQARIKERIAQLEARLASLTPEQRRQPAWYKRHPEGMRRLDDGEVVEAGSAGARPLVVPNPAYFDLALPKTTMQLVSVPFAEHYDEQVKKGKDDLLIRIPAAVIEQLDWKALGTRLK
jgi:hypothetical protein